MKKIWVAVMCGILCLSLAACNAQQAGSNPGGASDAASIGSGEAQDKTESTPEDEPDAASSQAPAAGGQTLEEYLEANKESFSQLTESMAESGMNIEILARGNSLVYSYQYTTDVGDAAQVKPLLDEAMDSLGSVFESSLSSIKLVVPSTESVVVEYLTKDGDLITSKEFK